jgi:hypothetical protein
VALIVTCSFLFKIKTAAAPVETLNPSDVLLVTGSDLVHDAMAFVEPTLAEKIVSVIEQIETNGHPDCGSVRGGSGERGCLQFQPATWRAYSSKLYGEVVTQTAEREREVAAYKAQEWLDSGYSPRQIFLTWNQGNPSPCKAGVNKFGVRFDSCAYARKGMALLENMQ